MRPIKYRAWVNNLPIRNQDVEAIRGKMLPVTGLYFFEGDELTSVSIDTEYGEQTDIAIDPYAVGLIPSDISIELMQFTGLEDYWGKDIYEGDIITHSELGGYKSVVTFEYGCVYAEGCESFPDKSWRYEIIGNIYENPELLEGGH